MRLVRTWIIIPVLAFVVGVVVGCSEDDGKKKSKKNSPDTPCAHPCNDPDRINGANVWGERFRISKNGLYKDFLKEYGVLCDPYSLRNWGIYSCDSWDQSAYLEISLNSKEVPSTGTATIWAYPSGMWAYGVPGFPVSISGEFKKTKVDGKDGFGLITFGIPGTGSYNARLKVMATGLASDNQIYVKIFYRDKEMGRSILYRYVD